MNEFSRSGAAPLTLGLYETTEQTMLEAHKAGMAYWKRNKPIAATPERLAELARFLHWYGRDNDAWLAGFYGAKSRDAL